MKKKNIRTVFFGPFIGEFGWEYSYWHAWVNKVCKDEFKDYHKIIASYPGRESFYSDADEYWSHPQDYLDKFSSCNGYITDYWKNGFPRPNASTTKKFLGVIPYERWTFVEKESDQICVEDAANELLEIYKDNLPKDAMIFCPFKSCSYQSMDFGVNREDNPVSDADITQVPIPFSEQDFDILMPSALAREKIINYLEPEQKIIAVFPRNRTHRRPDKNWSKEKYLDLISYLNTNFPEYKIGIFGVPGQAYFDDGVPRGALDFINLPDDQRMNLQIAALKQAYLAVGSLSGAMLVARSSGVPTLSWSLERDHDRFHGENRSNIETILHTIQNPDTYDIERLCSGILNKDIEYRSGFINWSSIEYLRAGDGNKKRLSKRLIAGLKNMLFARNKDYE